MVRRSGYWQFIEQSTNLIQHVVSPNKLIRLFIGPYSVSTNWTKKHKPQQWSTPNKLEVHELTRIERIGAHSHIRWCVGLDRYISTLTVFVCNGHTVTIHIQIDSLKLTHFPNTSIVPNPIRLNSSFSGVVLLVSFGQPIFPPIVRPYMPHHSESLLEYIAFAMSNRFVCAVIYLIRCMFPHH